jgi:carbon-monoxide dehydrogenase medium subunit
MLPPFAVARPRSVSAALAELDEDSVPYWGGTELLLAMRMGLIRPRQLVDLKGIVELTDVRVQDGELVIGAGLSHDEIARHPLVRAEASLLAYAEQLVGNARVRAQGTIGGNLCFAEPRSDVGTVLLALSAQVRLVAPGTERRLDIDSFLLGPYWTDRQPEELLVDIRIPLPSQTGVYLKYQTVERPTVGVAAVRRGSDGCRLVIGAVGELPVAFDVDDVAEVDAEAIAAQIEPTPDLTGSIAYKRHVTAVYIKRALAQLAQGNQP